MVDSEVFSVVVNGGCVSDEPSVVLATPSSLNVVKPPSVFVTRNVVVVSKLASFSVVT